MPPDRWHQHNITFADRETAQRAITERLGPALLAGRGRRAAHRLVVHEQAALAAALPRRQAIHQLVESLLSDLVGDGAVRSWTARRLRAGDRPPSAEPTAMDAAHDLFHSDSRHLLTYQPEPDATRDAGRPPSSWSAP